MGPVVSSFNLTNLDPYTEYSISVTAVNTIGIGPWSDNIMSYSPEEIPPAPEKVIIIKSTTTSLTVLIDATKPYNLNGNISHYIIQYRQQESDEFHTVTVSANSFKLTYTIRELPSYTDLNIRVRMLFNVYAFHSACSIGIMENICKMQSFHAGDFNSGYLNGALCPKWREGFALT